MAWWTAIPARWIGRGALGLPGWRGAVKSAGLAESRLSYCAPGGGPWATGSARSTRGRAMTVPPDEANSVLGALLAVPGLPDPLTSLLTEVQHELFDLGGELCIPGHVVITAEHVTRLEKALDDFNDPLPPLKEFILPGGGPAAAACHLGRTVARRAERRAWTLARTETVNPELLRYLNRLSDLLFVLARVLARHERGAEVLWRHDRAKKRG